MLLDLVVKIHDMQNIEQLSLILMQTLYLHIKDRSRIDLDAIVLFDIFRQTQFVLVFDVHELMLCLFIIRIEF